MPTLAFDSDQAFDAYEYSFDGGFWRVVFNSFKGTIRSLVALSGAFIGFETEQGAIRSLSTATGQVTGMTSADGTIRGTSAIPSEPA